MSKYSKFFSEFAVRVLKAATSDAFYPSPTLAAANPTSVPIIPVREITEPTQTVRQNFDSTSPATAVEPLTTTATVTSVAVETMASDSTGNFNTDDVEDGVRILEQPNDQDDLGDESGLPASDYNNEVLIDEEIFEDDFDYSEEYEDGVDFYGDEDDYGSDYANYDLDSGIDK